MRPKWRLPALSPAQFQPEVRCVKLLSYLWARQFFQDSGDQARGKRDFIAKHCADCHQGAAGAAPKLIGGGQTFTSPSMVAALWHHGPAMLQQMQSRRIQWPRLDCGRHVRADRVSQPIEGDQEMNWRPNRPLVDALTGHWVSMAGTALVTLAGFSWLFLLPLHISGKANNPYLGLLAFIALPRPFFTNRPVLVNSDWRSAWTPPRRVRPGGCGRPARSVVAAPAFFLLS